MEMQKTNGTVSFVQFLHEFDAKFALDESENVGLSTLDVADENPLLDAGENGSNLMPSSVTAIARHEIGAEANALALQFLNQCKCPPSLAAALTSAALEDFTETFLDDGETGDIDRNTLWKSVTSRVRGTCKEWLHMPEDALDIIGDDQLAISICAVKNGRRKMEDRHVIIPDLVTLFGIENQPKSSFYAVFDGHAGTEAANYAAVHLHYNIVHHPDFCNGNVEKAVQEAFTITDDNFIAKSNRDGLKSGSTALCCLVQGKKLYVAWVGDSQAVLVRGGHNVDLMVPHKPDRQDEKERIESLGGCVIHFGTWRVNGTLAVSRAIGDIEFKPFVSSNADITVVDLDGTEDFVLLACDGLWDVLQPQEAIDVVYSYLAHNAGDVDGVSARLVQVAKERGSSDNITVIVAFLRDLNELQGVNPKGFANGISSELQMGVMYQNFDQSPTHEVVNGNPFGSSMTSDDGLLQNFNNFPATFEQDFTTPQVECNETLQTTIVKEEVDIYGNISDSHDFVDFGTRTLRRNQIKPGSIQEFNKAYDDDDLFMSSNPFGDVKTNIVDYEFAVTTTTTHEESTNPFGIHDKNDFINPGFGIYVTSHEISNESSAEVPLDMPAEPSTPLISNLSPNAPPFIMPSVPVTDTEFDADCMFYQAEPTAPPVETITPLDENGRAFVERDQIIVDGDENDDALLNDVEVINSDVNQERLLQKEVVDDEALLQQEVVDDEASLQQEAIVNDSLEQREVVDIETFLQQELVDSYSLSEQGVVENETLLQQEMIGSDSMVMQEINDCDTLVKEEIVEIMDNRRLVINDNFEDELLDLKPSTGFDATSSIDVEFKNENLDDQELHNVDLLPQLGDSINATPVAVENIIYDSEETSQKTDEILDVVLIERSELIEMPVNDAVTDKRMKTPVDAEIVLSSVIHVVQDTDDVLEKHQELSSDLIIESTTLTDDQEKDSNIEVLPEIPTSLENAAVADDVEDDESEDGEEWKFYRMGAKDGDVKKPSPTSPLTPEIIPAHTPLSTTTTFATDFDVSLVKPIEVVEGGVLNNTVKQKITSESTKVHDAVVPDVAPTLIKSKDKPLVKPATASSKTAHSTKPVAGTSVTSSKSAPSKTVKSTTALKSTKVDQPALKKQVTATANKGIASSASTVKSPATKRPTSETAVKSAMVSAATRKTASTTATTKSSSSVSTKRSVVSSSTVTTKSAPLVPAVRKVAPSGTTTRPINKPVIAATTSVNMTLKASSATSKVAPVRKQPSDKNSPNGLNRVASKTTSAASPGLVGRPGLTSSLKTTNVTATKPSMPIASRPPSSTRTVTATGGILNQKTIVKKDVTVKQTHMDVKETKEKVNKEILGTIKGLSPSARSPRPASLPKTNDKSPKNIPGKPMSPPKAANNLTQRVKTTSITTVKTTATKKTSSSSPRPIAGSLKKNVPLKNGKHVENNANEKGILDADSKEINISEKPKTIDVDSGEIIVADSGVLKVNDNQNLDKSDAEALPNEDSLVML